MIGNTAVAGGGGLGGHAGDLDDLNRTLYDIGAQDMLDIWEHMDAEVGKY